MSRIWTLALASFLTTVFSVGHAGELIAQQPATATAAASTPVPFQTVVRIAPANTRIEFVGTHVGDDPKPRLGGFSVFEGLIGVDPEKQQITSMDIGIEIGSVWTEFDKLTMHLANADFFETEKFPAARFRSTKVTTLQNGTCNVAGELTLHGQTAEIMFPASYRMSENGLELNAQFFLDRTLFGMDKMTDGVEKMVSVNLVVGSPTKSAESSDGNGSGSSDRQASQSGSAGNDSAAPMTSKTVTVNLPNMT